MTPTNKPLFPSLPRLAPTTTPLAKPAHDAFKQLGPEALAMAEQLGVVKIMSCDEELEKFITEDAAMLRVKEHVRILSKLSCQDSVFIHGETGTGKEILARALHGGRQGPFVPVNCAAIPEALIESELFGNTGTAFTGAGGVKKVGLIETAHNGTLFLDEVAELPFLAQAKLLRFLQEGEIRPVGSSAKPTIVDARVVCASHKELEQEVYKGRFREDLYWRLATFVLRIIPLRKRLPDIDQLVSVMGTITDEQLEIIKKRPLMGNVRELQTRVKRIVALGEDYD